MSEEWGPWQQHCGGGCPVDPRMYVQVYSLDGDIDEAVAGDFCWPYAEMGGFFQGYITRYRVKNPRGMVILEEILEKLPEPVSQ